MKKILNSSKLARNCDVVVEWNKNLSSSNTPHLAQNAISSPLIPAKQIPKPIPQVTALLLPYNTRSAESQAKGDVPDSLFTKVTHPVRTIFVKTFGN